MKELKIKPDLKLLMYKMCMNNVYVYQNTNATINNIKQINCSSIRLYVRHGGHTKVLHFLLEDSTPTIHKK